jgi:multidrug efflux pump subunit AcrB
VSQLNGTRITLQFDLGRDINGAARDVQAAINAASNELPADLPSPPTYRKANPNDTPVLILALTSEAVPLSQIYNQANELVVPPISQIAGVSEVDIGGGAKTAVRVQVDPAALAAMGLSIDNVRAVLRGQNKNEPKGAIDGDRISFTMSVNDQLFSAEQYKNLIIGKKNGVPIPLSVVGRAIDATEDRLQAGWFNSKRAVVMFVRKQAEANVIETVDRIKAILPQLQRRLPPAIHLQILSDRTRTIRASVADVQTCLVISVALVVMICFLFLRRLSATFIACITVPLALAGTFATMYLLKFSLDNISLMALTISVGFVVDDAIVVIENIVRHLERGLAPLEATLRGARQIGFTIVSISISLVAVFIPLLFMGGIIGRLFHEFSVTLGVAVLVSAVVSLTLTPMLCSRLLREEKPEQFQGWFYRATEKLFKGMLGIYSRSLRWVLQHSFIMLLVTAGTLCVTIWLYTIVPKGFFPQQDTGMVTGITEAAQDISFDAMVQKQNLVTQIVMRDPAVESVASAVGSGGGGNLNTGRMFITLKPRKERNVTATEFVARIRAETANLPGIGVFLQAAQDIRVGGRATKGQYIYSLVSPSQEDLNAYVPKLMATLQKNPMEKSSETFEPPPGFEARKVTDSESWTKQSRCAMGVPPTWLSIAAASSGGVSRRALSFAQQLDR